MNPDAPYGMILILIPWGAVGTGKTIGNLTMKRLAGGVNSIMAMGLQLLIGNATSGTLWSENSTPIQWQMSQRARGVPGERTTPRKAVKPKCRAAAPVPDMRVYRDFSRKNIFEGMTMEKPTQQPEQPHNVACEVCRKEIPRSEAQSAEAVDYVLYFCGVDCYQKWEANSQTRQDSTRGAP